MSYANIQRQSYNCFILYPESSCLDLCILQPALKRPSKPSLHMAPMSARYHP